MWSKVECFSGRYCLGDTTLVLSKHWTSRPRTCERGRGEGLWVSWQMSPLEPLPDWIKSSNSNAFAEGVPIQDTDDLSISKQPQRWCGCSGAQQAAPLSYHSFDRDSRFTISPL